MKRKDIQYIKKNTKKIHEALWDVWRGGKKYSLTQRDMAYSGMLFICRIERESRGYKMLNYIIEKLNLEV